MDNLNSDLTQIPLSGEDLIEICMKLSKPKNQMAWITYDGLQDVNSLDDLFVGETNSVFILLTPPNEQIGHWITLGKNQHGYFYFDPYGFSIEEDLKIVRANDRLLMLLQGLLIDVNTFKHQELGNSMETDNTCGRHDCVRAFFYHLTNRQYNDLVIRPLIDNKLVNNADTIVNLLTAFLSKSDQVVAKYFGN